MKTPNGWKSAVVSNIAAKPRSYIVNTGDGGNYRRNRRDLMLTKEKTSEELNDMPVRGEPSRIPVSVPSPPGHMPAQHVSSQNTNQPISRVSG